MTTPDPDPTPSQPDPAPPDDPIGHSLDLLVRAEHRGRQEGADDHAGWLLALSDAWAQLTQASALARLAAAVECLDRQAHDGFFRTALVDEPGSHPHPRPEPQP